MQIGKELKGSVDVFNGEFSPNRPHYNLQNKLWEGTANIVKGGSLIYVDDTKRSVSVYLLHKLLENLDGLDSVTAHAEGLNIHCDYASFPGDKLTIPRYSLVINDDRVFYCAEVQTIRAYLMDLLDNEWSQSGQLNFSWLWHLLPKFITGRF